MKDKKHILLDKILRERLIIETDTCLCDQDIYLCQMAIKDYLKI